MIFILFYLFYLFGVLRRFQHCTGHITTGSWKGRGNQYIEFARVVYCKLPTNGKQLPAFPLKAVTGIEPPTSEVGGESVTTLPPWPPRGLFECSDTNAQISERLECVISNYEAQANDHTAWGGWMTREVWPSFQQRSMDLVNLSLCESKAVADREQHNTSLQLDERQLD